MMGAIGHERSVRSTMLMKSVEDDGLDNDFDEDVNKADYELDRHLHRELATRPSTVRQDEQARVRCLFQHQDVGADLSGIGFDEVFDARIGSVLSELAGMVEGE